MPLHTSIRPAARATAASRSASRSARRAPTAACAASCAASSAAASACAAAYCLFAVSRLDPPDCVFHSKTSNKTSGKSSRSKSSRTSPTKLEKMHCGMVDDACLVPVHRDGVRMDACTLSRAQTARLFRGRQLRLGRRPPTRRLGPRSARLRRSRHRRVGRRLSLQRADFGPTELGQRGSEPGDLGVATTRGGVRSTETKGGVGRTPRVSVESGRRRAGMIDKHDASQLVQSSDC